MPPSSDDVQLFLQFETEKMKIVMVIVAVEHSLPEDCPALSLMEMDEKDTHRNRLMLKIFDASRRMLLETVTFTNLL